MSTFASSAAVLGVLLLVQADVTWSADMITPLPSSPHAITPLPSSPHDRECIRRNDGAPACRKDCGRRYPEPNPNTYCDAYCTNGALVRGWCIVGAGGSLGCPGIDCTF